MSDEVTRIRSFPDGRTGAGLLLLRLTVGGVLVLVGGLAPGGSMPGGRAVGWLAVASGALLAVGLCTSAAGALVASGPFFGFNRPGAKVSQGLINSWWRQGMMSGHKNAYDCIKAFSETDFTEDLKRLAVPTLVVHGDDDQIVPIGASALLSSKLVKGATLKVYPGGSHSLGDTSKERLNADLLAFLKA
jgi:pimeloyl-ACP methyl ester carboxylesterase